MKRYIISAMLATFVGGILTSCHDTDIQYSSIAESKLAQFQENFEKFYGKVNPNQDWGFGNAISARTRASQTFTQPTFRDKNDISASVPTFYTTLNDAVTQGGAVYAGTANLSWSNNMAVYIDKDHPTVENKDGLTIYVSGDVNFYSEISANGNGTTIVVLEDSKLTLGSGSDKDNLKIYLAPRATLDLTKEFDINYQTWPWTVTPKDKTGNYGYGINKSNARLYLSSGSTVNVGTGTLYIKNDAKVYNNGGTIYAGMIDLREGNGATLWNEGTIEATTVQCTNVNDYIYNGANATITATNLSLINNNDLLVNDGTLTVTNGVALQNSSAEIVNHGDFSAASYRQAAGGKFRNTGSVTITGLTYLDNSNSYWKNDGQWTCGEFEITGYAENTYNNFNNCLLTVTNKDGESGQFKLNRGTLVLGNNAGVVCESFYWDDTSGFWLGDNSVLKVNGTLLSNNYNSGYGFHGYGNAYAVIQANKIDKTANNQFSMSYYGKLLVATSDHFGQGYIDNPNTNQPYYMYENTVKFTFKGEDISPITATTCNPGYKSGSTPTTGGSTGSTTTTTDVYIKKEVKLHKWVFCEDLGNSYTKADFDYNDLVFDVKVIDEYRVVRDADGTETVYTGDASHSYYALFTPLAAGGELQIMFSGCDKFAHAMFSPAWGDNVLINTAKDPDALAAPCNYSTGTSESFRCLEQSTLPTLDDINNVDINVKAKYNDGDVAVWTLTAYLGKAPHKICVPPGTRWPYERVSIDEAYTGFSNYVDGGSAPWDNGVNDNLYPLTDLAENLITNQEGLAYEYVKDTENSNSTTTYSITPSSTETLVWQDLEGTAYLGSDWDDQEHVIIDYHTLAQADPNNKPFGVGSVIRAYVITEDGFNVQLFTQDAAPTYTWTKLFESYYGRNDSHISNNSGYVEYTVTKADLDVLKRGCLAVSGIKATLVGVTVDNTNSTAGME